MTKPDKQLIVPLEHKDGSHVMLNLSRESQKRIHSFKWSMPNIKHEPLSLRYSILFDCQ